MGRGERLVLLLITLLLVSLCFMLLMPSGKTGTAGLMAAPTDTLTDFQKNLKPVAVTPEKHPELHTKQRKDTIITDEHYVGPPVHLKTSSVQKLKSGSMVDINTADSALLTRVPGIGAAFAVASYVLENAWEAFIPLCSCKRFMAWITTVILPLNLISGYPPVPSVIRSAS
ncbi:hypothetical protein [Porphyromonas macacae]|uniref:hypothetical protein n=1 Tax=Porphyromonas macacae TaxID=28115 RepID=UPI0006854F19|nr:hypothetical protein [Porphyromonas macacae]